TVDLYYRSAEEFDFEEYTQELLSVPNPDLTGKSPLEVVEILEGSLLVIGEEVFEENATTQNARVYRQEPNPEEQATILRGTEINIWYRPEE
ncbi:MAG: PASTA domain-containing protein, partial [Bacteroidota bacterium]